MALLWTATVVSIDSIVAILLPPSFAHDQHQQQQSTHQQHHDHDHDLHYAIIPSSIHTLATSCPFVLRSRCSCLRVARCYDCSQCQQRREEIHVSTRTVVRNLFETRCHSQLPPFPLPRFASPISPFPPPPLRSFSSIITTIYTNPLTSPSVFIHSWKCPSF